jgi:hypothetical protein
MLFLTTVTFEFLVIHGSAIHIAYRILAAFFIDMGAKTSIVENLIISTFLFICLEKLVFFFYSVSYFSCLTHSESIKIHTLNDNFYIQLYRRYA